MCYSKFIIRGSWDLSYFQLDLVPRRWIHFFQHDHLLPPKTHHCRTMRPQHIFETQQCEGYKPKYLHARLLWLSQSVSSCSTAWHFSCSPHRRPLEFINIFIFESPFINNRDRVSSSRNLTHTHSALTFREEVGNMNAVVQWGADPPRILGNSQW